MAKSLWFFLTSYLLAGVTSSSGLKKSYIIHLDGPEGGGKLLKRSSAEASLKSVSAQPADILYTYEHVLNGYAAQLTDEQADALRAQPDVLAVTPDQMYRLHTTRTPQFLGLVGNDALLGRSPLDSDLSAPHMYARADDAGAEAESELVVGVFDTGVWPENPGFHDGGLGPIPARWKGMCEEGDGWTASNCNKKLIGARAFYKAYVAAMTNGTHKPFNWTGQYKSARDSDGHGTHTSTTAAGSAVQGASLYGQAYGTARGMAEHARVAMYKVCWDEGCVGIDILAGMDKAIADGVNVMSLSLGADTGPVGIDGVSLGAFSAMEKGIFVSTSAGNDGPDYGTVENVIPWVLTVAASTLDRKFPASVTLGNGKTYTGVSLYSNTSVTDIEPLARGEALPLIDGSLAAKANSSASTFCLKGSLDPEKVAGKVVLCLRGKNARVKKGVEVKAAGGRGMILCNPKDAGEDVVPDAHLLPALHVGFTAASELKSYAKTQNATVVFDFEGTKVGYPAPYMAGFSSRGPSLPFPGLAKPDVTAPGVGILAGWANISPGSVEEDTRKVMHNIISGTSMSCPHVSGIAAYIMARRPEWSPAAVRSALMTTAYDTLRGGTSPIVDTVTSEPANPFSYGNGHVDPIAALDPGLIYDLTRDDYVNFLCAVYRRSKFVSQVVRRRTTCDLSKTPSVNDLNYPSFSAVYNSSVAKGGTYTANFTRTVTNVGTPGTYKVDVSLSDTDLVKVSVEPDSLTFASVGENKTYVVTASLKSAPTANAFFATWGKLVWSDGKHKVGSSLYFLWGVPSFEDSQQVAKQSRDGLV